MERHILGVKIHEINASEALNAVDEAFVNTRQIRIFTVNPEMLVQASRDLKFKEVLNSSTISLCDGFGLWLAGLVKGYNFTRVTGVDFMIDLARFAEKNSKKVFLLGSGFTNVVEKARDNLLVQFPKLMIVGTHPGPVVSEDGKMSAEDEIEILENIHKSRPDILMVAFGMKKQEFWIDAIAGKILEVVVLIGLGGSFDFVSGKVSRAPGLMRKIGVEWMYRLAKEPWRFRRILNATFKFPYLVFKETWQKMF